MIILACCLNCENRKIGCHSTCELYIAECKEREELKRKEKMAHCNYPTRNYTPYVRNSNLSKFNKLNKRGEHK